MNKAYLLIGGNLGNRQQNIIAAKVRISEEAGQIINSSAIYETAAWGLEDQPAFLNQVLLIQTNLPPEQLLIQLLKIEDQLGRRRAVLFGPRTMDIDILFYNDEIVDEPDLKIPHPSMQDRRFVLEPLNEIAPSYVHPKSGQTVSELLSACTDPLSVQKVT